MSNKFDASPIQTDAGDDDSQTAPGVNNSKNIPSNKAGIVEAGPTTKQTPASSESGNEKDVANNNDKEKELAKQINHAPVSITAKNFQISESKKKATLDGSDSTDKDNDKLDYSWKQVQGKPSVKLHDKHEPKAQFVVPDVKKDTKFVFELVVKDEHGAMDSDRITVLVKKIEEPLK
jgi:hypothetical protein